MITKVLRNRPLAERSILNTVILFLVCISLYASQAIAAESPRSVVQTFTDEVFQILRQHPQNTLTRRVQIQAVVDRCFDTQGMASLALGRAWRRLYPEQRQEFTEEFTKLLYYQYIGDIEKFAGQRIMYYGRSISPNQAMVEASVGGGQVSVDYWLYLKDGNWKIYDVSVQGMSVVLNYRDQFAPILTYGSFKDLSMMLREQIARMCGSYRC